MICEEKKGNCNSNNSLTYNIITQLLESNNILIGEKKIAEDIVQFKFFLE